MRMSVFDDFIVEGIHNRLKQFNSIQVYDIHLQVLGQNSSNHVHNYDKKNI